MGRGGEGERGRGGEGEETKGREVERERREEGTRWQYGVMLVMANV